MRPFENRDAGSARKLEGKVYVLLFYVGTPSTPVTAETHEGWRQEVFEAEHWIEEQASRYGRHLEFENAAYGLDGSLVMGDIPSGPETPDAFFFPEKVYALQGFKNGWDVFQFVRGLCPGSDHYISLVLCNAKGRSFACAVSQELCDYDSRKFWFESSVLYRYEAVDYVLRTTSASLAHEILHLFGAEDMYAYDDSLSERRKEQTYRSLYPRSIMLGAPDGIHEAEVDELNAYLVGWRDKPRMV